MSYDAGEAFVQIVPSFKGVVEQITAQAKSWGTASGKSFAQAFNDQLRKSTDVPIGPSTPTSTKQGQASGGAFADAFKARVTAALKSLPNPKVGLDATELDAELAEIRERLAALGDVRVGVDLSAEAATAELDALKARIDELGAKSASIDVRVDTARASAELAVIQAEVEKLNGENADVDVDVDDHGSAAEAESGVSGVTAAVLALGPALIPIGAAAAVGIGGIVTAAGAGLGALGVLALAISGVVKAVGLLGQEHTAAAAAASSAAKSETSSAASIASAQAQVKSATEGLAQARQNAANAAISSAEAVKNAEQSLADAERTAATQQIAAAQAVTSAQQALNQAREQAARDLEAASDNQVDAVLSQKQATIDLANAQATNTATQASSTATDLEKQQALLDLQKAQQALVEANQQVTQTTQDNTKAQADGVSGAPAVVAAAQALANARKAQAAQEVQSTESVKKAEQGVTDALRAQAVQQRQSVYSVEQAQEGLASATRAVGTAQESAGSSGSTALAKVRSQLALLSPATVAFAKYVRGTIEPAFRQLQGAAAAGLLPGVKAGLQAAQPLFASLAKFVGSLASTMGRLAAQAGKALTDPFWTRFFAFVSKIAGPTLVTMAHIVENLGKGFAGLLIAFYPLDKGLGAGIDDLSKRFANFGAHAGQNSGLRSFLDYLKQEGPVVVATLGKIITAIGHLAVALAPIGDLVLKGIGYLADAINAVPTPVLTTIAAFILPVVLGLKAWAVAQGILNAVMEANPLVLLVLLIAGLVLAIIEAYKHSQTFRDIVQAAWRDVRSTISGAWHDVIKPVFDALEAAGKAVGHFFAGPFVSFFTTGMSDLEGAAKAIGRFFSGTFVGFFTGAWSDIKSATRTFIRELGTIWDGVEKLFDAPVKFVINTVLNKGLIGVWDWVVGKIPGAGKLNIPLFKLPQGFAGGGVIPGYAPGVDSVMAMVSPGEAILRPEVTRALGADTIHGWNRAAASGAMPHFSLGGIWGDVKGTASSIIGGISDVAGALADPAKWIKDKIAKVLGSISSFGSTDFGKIIQAVPAGIGKALIDSAKSLIGFGGGGGSGTPIPAGAHLALIAAALKDAGVAVNGPNEAAVNVIVDHESGWNARAINLTDSNAAAGDPSRGLMQTIMTTFEAHRDKALPDDIYNPLANLVAGIGYAVGRYGSLLNVPGVVAVAHGRPYVGYDAGGTLDPGYQLVYNGTNRPEIVAPRQTFDQIMSGASGGGDGLGDVTVFAQFGAETIEAVAVRVVKERAARVAVTSRKATG